jgi:hypothetical protein
LEQPALDADGTGERLCSRRAAATVAEPMIQQARAIETVGVVERVLAQNSN